MRKSSKQKKDKKSWIPSSGSVSAKIKVKPYTMSDICEIYDLTYKSMLSSLKPILADLGKKNGRYFNVGQVEMIFNQMGGVPYTISEK